MLSCQGQFNPPSGVWRASSRGSIREINPGTCPGRPGDAAEQVCEQKKCQKKKSIFVEVFRGASRFSPVPPVPLDLRTDNHRLGRGLSGLSENSIGVSFEDVHEEIFDVTGFPD